MDILFVLIPLSLILVIGGCWAFFWAVDAGQFEDLDSASWDVLNEGHEKAPASSASPAPRIPNRS
jgi:cbb3-type cytochrome oxidase maturation protein